MRPTRFDLTLEYARSFVTEWFDQNPLGQIGIVGMRGGIGERICEMSGASPLPCSLSFPFSLFLFILFFSSSFELCIGNPQDVLHAISERHKLEPAGEPSLQNAIEMARSSMRFVVPTPPCPNHVLLTDVARNRADLRIISHLPTHSSREILITFGSLTTVDPGNIYETLSSCVKDRIRISLVALAAEMKICRELCDKTGGTPLLLFALTSPPLLFPVAYI